MKQICVYLFVIGLVACNNNPRQEIKEISEVNQFDHIVKYNDSVFTAITTDYQRTYDSIQRLNTQPKFISLSHRATVNAVQRLKKLYLEIEQMPNDKLTTEQKATVTQLMFTNLQSQATLDAVVSRLEESPLFSKNRK